MIEFQTVRVSLGFFFSDVLMLNLLRSEGWKRERDVPLFILNI